MGQKNNGKTAAAFKFLAFIVLLLLFSETAFAQVSSGLILNLRADVRYEPAISHNTKGYNLYVRKKQGMESVMLTEPTGNYALRTLGKFNENDGIRNLSGKRLPPNDPYSCFSIISSTPVQDGQYGRAFKLFIPETVIFANPSVRGPFSMYALNGFQFNIRTFDRKYGDPNMSNFRDILYTLPAMAQNTGAVVNPIEFASAYPSNNTADADTIRRELGGRLFDDVDLGDWNEEELIRLFFELIGEMGSRRGM